MLQENKKIIISYWLLLITFLVALMIVIGGLTRLTDSGLSITKWDLFVGVLPPLTLDDWNNAFNLYKKIPEYKLQNYNMTLSDFKTIYWWEYIHRILGRLIGLAYLIPLIIFTYKKFIKKNEFFSFYLILFLIILQGFIGWYMVSSGLTERIDVSHYRLSLHLILAFIIYILLLWNFLILQNKKKDLPLNNIPYYLPVIFLFTIIIQIGTGALVSGLDAGKIYQSWPLMNGNYFPNDANINELFSLNALEIPSIVQFIHRNIAYLIIFIFFLIVFNIYKNDKFNHLKRICFIIFISLFLQIFLGVLTILSGAQIFFASIHQIGSIILISSALLLVYKNSNFS